MPSILPWLMHSSAILWLLRSFWSLNFDICAEETLPLRSNRRVEWSLQPDQIAQIEIGRWLLPSGWYLIASSPGFLGCWYRGRGLSPAKIGARKNEFCVITFVGRSAGAVACSAIRKALLDDDDDDDAYVDRSVFRTYFGRPISL